jgi:hypothetical protein
MRPCPSVIDKAKVICYTPIDGCHSYTGNTKQIASGKILDPAAGLVIGQYQSDSSFYLLGCDVHWNVKSDTWHATLEDALSQAEFEHEGTRQTWRDCE